MEVRVDVHHHHPSSGFCRSSSLNMPHHNFSGETMVASPLAHHWNPTLRNNMAGGSMANVNQGQTRKRDFHFQVIQVHQGPKWFFFPSQQSEDQTGSKTINSNQENERTRLEQPQVPHTTINSESTQQLNSYAAERMLRKSSRLRKQQLHQLHNAKPVEGGFKNPLINCKTTEPSSEPITRRISSKPIIQVTPCMPIKTNSCQESCSSSMPSSTFKILSVAKKNDDSDDEDVLECSCRKLSLSLDDDCDLPRETHVNGYLSLSSSGCSSSPSSTLSTCPSTISSASPQSDSSNSPSTNLSNNY